MRGVYLASLQNEKLMYEIAQENKRLSEPLTKALKEVEALRQALASLEKDKMSLAQTKVGQGTRARQGKHGEHGSELTHTSPL